MKIIAYQSVGRAICLSCVSGIHCKPFIYYKNEGRIIYFQYLTCSVKYQSEFSTQISFKKCINNGIDC